jgi:hypothetical protein
VADAPAPDLRRQQGDAVIGLRVRTPIAGDHRQSATLVDGTGYNIIEIDPSRKHKGELLVTCQAEDTAP